MFPNVTRTVQNQIAHSVFPCYDKETKKECKTHIHNPRAAQMAKMANIGLHKGAQVRPPEQHTDWIRYSKVLPQFFHLFAHTSMWISQGM